MTLLSKTLQTLLYKYLSDVDVEGVALPSLYNTDGHSGWGVRLSNVKLREGAKLMNLPGKPRPRRRRRRNKRQKQPAAGSSEADTNSEKHQGESVLSESIPADPPGDLACLVMSPSVESSLAESAIASGVETASDVPKRPSTLSRWFSWSSKPPQAPEEEEDKPSGAVSAPTSANASSIHGEIIQDGGGDPLFGIASKEEVLTDFDEEGADEKIDGLEEAEGEVEPPMILRLGKNGSIGVLDVRLMGKNMHVMVEDASLTVEVIRLSFTSEEDAGDKETKLPAGSSAERKTPSAKKAPKTVADRVLAEIALARIFSATPNLLLRDIHIRVIVRDETSSSLEEPREEIGMNDSIVEFNIELLSVTDGEDFLANFQVGLDDDGSSSADSATTVDEEDDIVANLSGVDKSNEYEIKRIRTGRGPDGGITVRSYSGKDLLSPVKKGPTAMWARQTWKSATDHYAFRLSGLDLQARVFMGQKEDMSDEANFLFDDFNVDSMLFGGVDYIAPGPQPPLPPMLNQDGGVGDVDDQSWTVHGATSYVVDTNGVQRCGIRSSFHKVARGLRPSVCQNNHLPCEYCAECWTSPPGTQTTSVLDDSTPMGGLVLHVSLRDPLEINFDRQMFETVGLLLDLFKKDKSSTDDIRPEEIGSEHPVDDTSEQPGLEGSQRSYRSNRSFFSRSSANLDDSTRGKISRSSSTKFDDSFRGLNGAAPLAETENDIESSYPSYMQPEKIQILGLHLSEVRFRVHALNNDGLNDTLSSFRYWDLTARCLSADIQLLAAQERPFKDLRLDVGNLTVNEFGGAEKRQLASLGLRQPEVDFDEVTAETLMTKETNMRPPWPSSAAALLDLRPPLESLVYESRERHALQLRYYSVSHPGDSRDRSWGHVSVKLGPTVVDTPFSIRQTLSTALSEVGSIMVGPKQPQSDTDETKSRVSAEDHNNNPLDSLLKYKLQFEGGRIRMDPLFDISLPLSTVTGERSSLTGISFETFLQNVGVKFSKPAPEVAEHGLSLNQIAELPENVRLRLLLFLPDLTSLELALGIRSEANSFLRCRAVNKGLVKAARRNTKISRRGHGDSSTLAQERHFQRQELLTELMKLDDDQLQELWMNHLRNKRRQSANGSRSGRR